MDTRDRDAISSLFQKLHDVERQAGPRDAEAERFISAEAQRLPGAPYYMAQTIVMQDMALRAKQAEIDALKQAREEQPAPRNQGNEGGGFLSRMFGGGEPTPERGQPASARGGPWGGSQQSGSQHVAQPQYAPTQYAPQGGGFGRGMGGGGFLAGAAQTAMGVAGGVVLGNALGSMFGGHGGLFGGGSEQPTEVNETTNTNEGGQDGNADTQTATDTGADDNAGGYQDASFDDASNADNMGDFGGDDAGGMDDI